MSSNNQNNVVYLYIDLDSLLDSRYALYEYLNRDKAKEYLLSGEYYKRIDNIFPGIDIDKYNDLYNNREKYLLNSDMDYDFKLVPTILIGELIRLLTEVYKKNCGKDTDLKINLVVNVYPYKLSIDQQTIVSNSILMWIKLPITIDIININPLLISPKDCKNKYEIMIMYDYQAWLEANSNEFKTYFIPTITLIAPKLRFKILTNEEELKVKELLSTMNCDEFKLIESISIPIINLELIDSIFFSRLITEEDRI